MATKTNNDPIKPKKKNDFGVMTPQEEARFRKEYNIPKDKDITISQGDLDNYRKGVPDRKMAYSLDDKKAPEKPKREEITAKLPTKKLVSKPIDKSIQKSSTQKKVAANKPKFEPAPKTKKLTKGGGRTGNIGTAIKNVVGKQVFKKEEKMAGAYKRATSASGTGSQAGMNKADRSIDLKDQVKNLKSVRKDVKKSTGYDVKKDIKDTKKALKWSEKVGSGNNRYLSISGRKK
jgi:uncharacterized protein YcfJ